MEEKEYREICPSIPAIWFLESISKVNWFCTKLFSKNHTVSCVLSPCLLMRSLYILAAFS